MNEDLEQYKKLRIDVDEPFQFHCTQCGDCCRDREDILLTARDLFRIAKKLKMNPVDFIKNYGESYIGNPSRLPIVRLRPLGPFKQCSLLKNNKCLVHDAKPAVCAMFPVGRMLQMKPEGEQSVRMAKPQIEYICTHPGCGDDLETHTVREWLDTFGIDLEDSFFIQWSQTLSKLSVALQEEEKHTDSKSMIQLWHAIYICLYLNYDIDENFYPQFQANVEKIFQVLDLLHQITSEIIEPVSLSPAPKTDSTMPA